MKIQKSSEKFSNIFSNKIMVRFHSMISTIPKYLEGKIWLSKIVLYLLFMLVVVVVVVVVVVGVVGVVVVHRLQLCWQFLISILVDFLSHFFTHFFLGQLSLQFSDVGHKLHVFLQFVNIFFFLSLHLLGFWHFFGFHISMQVLRLSASARSYNKYTKKTKNGVLWLHLASFTLPIAKILSVKNVQAWVSMVLI